MEISEKKGLKYSRRQLKGVESSYAVWGSKIQDNIRYKNWLGKKSDHIDFSMPD